MKITEKDLLYFANNICNYTYRDNLKAVRQLVNLFDKIRLRPFRSIEDYINFYDDSFYTFHTWEELILSEIEQGDFGLTEDECKDQLGSTILKLPCGWYVQKIQEWS